MKDSPRFKQLVNDYKEATSLLQGVSKTTKYFWLRPLADFIIRRILDKKLSRSEVYHAIDKFLLNEGGMSKRHVYKICDNYYSLANASVLVPGVGYGRSLFQMASFKPKIIVGFDLYDYPEEWNYLKSEISRRFGVEIVFYKGGFDVLPTGLKKSIDFIISDAVLEHIQDVPVFFEYSRLFLKEGGIFYASFGPIWFGPSGDHIFWGKNNIFDHLFLSKEVYQKRFDEKFQEINRDSTEGAFLVKKSLFSYLKVEDYLRIASGFGFQKIALHAKISTDAISIFRKNPKVHELLDKMNIPIFDRYSSGIYLWAKKI